MINKHRSSRKGETYGNDYYWNCISLFGINSRSVFFGTKPRIEPLAFFRVLPSVRSYFRALKAIEKLNNIEYVIQDIKKQRFKGKAVLSSKDEGFKDLIMILRKCGDFEDKEIVEELIMHDTKGGLFGEPELMWLNAKIGNEERVVIASAALIPAIHILKETVNTFVQRKMDSFIVILAVAIFLVTIFLVLYSNLCVTNITR